MEGIEKITAKIAQDAQAEVSRVEAETQAQVNEILAQEGILKKGAGFEEAYTFRHLFL